MTTHSKNQIYKPKHLPSSIICYPIPNAILVESSSNPTKPTCYNLAIKDPLWRQAMDLEFNALLKNQIWKLVPPTTAGNIINYKWVFRIKQNANGSIERYKAWLVAKGYNQQLGVE